MIFDNYDELDNEGESITIGVDSLRRDLLDDCYGAYFGGGWSCTCRVI